MTGKQIMAIIAIITILAGTIFGTLIAAGVLDEGDAGVGRGIIETAISDTSTVVPLLEDAIE